MNWLESLACRPCSRSSNRGITRPCSKTSHFKEGPQKTSKPRKKTRQWPHTVDSDRGAMRQHVWSILCTVIWAPLRGSSLFNPILNLFSFTNFLSSCIWHNTILNEDKVSSAIFLRNLQQKWRDMPNIYWMCFKCWVQISVSHMYQSSGNVILARRKGQLEKLKPGG